VERHRQLGDVDADGCTLADNSGGSGAALSNRRPRRCRVEQLHTVSGNTATGDGGAIINTGTLTLTGCTLSGNTARDGGAIRNDANLTLTGCTLSGNTVRPGLDTRSTSAAPSSAGTAA